MPTNEPITEEVLREVASQLGAEWTTVATALGVTRPRVQVIQRNAMLQGSPQSAVNYEMLMMWAKALPKCADKVRSFQSRSYLTRYSYAVGYGAFVARCVRNGSCVCARVMDVLCLNGKRWGQTCY